MKWRDRGPSIRWGGGVANNSQVENFYINKLLACCLYE